MKKIIILFFTLFSFSYAAEVGDYKSDFGIGVGLGFPSGYEFKGIYRQNDWLSLSLNYNLFQIKGISEEIGGAGEDTDITVRGDFVFSNPGVMINYHPFGGNFRVSAGLLYDMGGLDINADGTLKIDAGGTPVDTDVTGSIKIKLGRTYPYLGIAYGYDYNSVVHLDLSLGVYMVKRPEVDLNFVVGDTSVVGTILTDAGITGQNYTDIMAAFEASGGNILDLAQIAADVLGVPSTIVLPNEQNLENDLISVIQEGYSYLPEFMGYNLLPVVSIGFVFFPF